MKNKILKTLCGIGLASTSLLPITMTSCGQEQYFITLESDANGEVHPISDPKSNVLKIPKSDAAGIKMKDIDAKITKTPFDGYEFKWWINADDGKILSPDSIINQNTKIKAIFYIKPGEITTSLEDLVSACNQLEQSSIDFDAFLSKISINGKTVNDAESLLGSYINVTIETNTYKAVIVDYQHDVLATDNTKKAALTFQLDKLLSDSSGKAIHSRWNDSNWDYTNSMLRKNISGNGTGTQTWSNTAISKFPTNIQNAIKTVTKEALVSTDSGSTYTKTNYNDTLFIPSLCEMGGTERAGTKWNNGHPYRYWWWSGVIEVRPWGEKHSIEKSDFSSRYTDGYWLATPLNAGDMFKNCAFFCSASGSFDYSQINMGITPEEKGVSLAFCF